MPAKYPRKGGPYWHVIRFLDHPLLPANTGRDLPKIIKHGISDDGPMHPKSPHVSAADGLATLLYKMGREDWLKKFLDIDGTLSFKLHIKRKSSASKYFYAKRNGRQVEIGLLSTCYEIKEEEGSKSQPDPGVRFIILPNGNWQPVSQCDQHIGDWYGSDVWVRGQSELVAKCIWFDKRWKAGDTITEISWSGMTEKEKEDAAKFVEEWKIKPPSEGYNDWDRLFMSGHKMTAKERDEEFWRLTDIERRECRGGCGTRDAKHVCSKCKEVYYCSRECQVDDWKWHKSVCGLPNSSDEEGSEDDIAEYTDSEGEDPEESEDDEDESDD